jgi:hypothetical protein
VGNSLKFASSWRDIIRVCCQNDRNSRPSFDTILKRLEPIYSQYRSSMPAPASVPYGHTSSTPSSSAPRRIESKSGEFKHMPGIDDIRTGSVDMGANHYGIHTGLSSSPMTLVPPSSYQSNHGNGNGAGIGGHGHAYGSGGLAAAAAAAAAATLTIGTPLSSSSSVGSSVPSQLSSRATSVPSVSNYNTNMNGSQPVAVPSSMGLGLRRSPYDNIPSTPVATATDDNDNNNDNNGNEPNVVSVASSPLLGESVTSHDGYAHNGAANSLATFSPSLSSVSSHMHIASTLLTHSSSGIVPTTTTTPFVSAAPSATIFGASIPDGTGTITPSHDTVGDVVVEGINHSSNSSLL